MKEIKYFSLIALLFFFSCKFDKAAEVQFSDDINRYNYLDKPHNLMYVYDFEDIFSEEKSNTLSKKLKILKDNKNLAFIIISDKHVAKHSFLKSTKITNDIFSSKFELHKIITIKISKSSGEVAIASSESLSNIISDSICSAVIDEILKPNFKSGNFYLGVNTAIDSLEKKVR